MFDARTTPCLLLCLTLLPLGCDSSSPTVIESGTLDAPEVVAKAGLVGEEGPKAEPIGPSIPFSAAQVFLEYNATANDMGFQLFLDAEGWENVAVTGPRVGDIVDIQARGPLSELGITEVRFESAEPSPSEVLALFPAGQYRFRGETVEGATLTGSARLSHSLLAAPTFSPSNGQVVDPANAIVTWKAPGAELVEIIIESDELPHVLDVTVSGSTTSLRIPPQFLVRGTEYKIEILAIGSNRNRTIVEGTFVTQP